MNNCEFSCIFPLLQGNKTVYIGYASGVYWAQHLNAREAPDRTIACGVPDFKERQELCRETPPQRTIHFLISSLHPNPIVPTALVPEIQSASASRAVDVVNVSFLECWNRDCKLR